MLKIAIPAVAALGLIAFAAQSQATNPDAHTGVVPMGWHLSHEGPMAKLAYGVENSDQLALMMTCERGQTQATVYGDARPSSPRLIKASLSTEALDPLSGELADEARISVRDPALQQLARRGTLEVEGEAGRFELTATRDERRLIGDFFAYCGTGRA
ncbi:hypothetical protein [Brevundimonas sp.]|uniref:hypothetical protein n=1 Tax=Brevundimonas sp. TaxID=1871086 RepID=UPI002737DEE9|nr:hypothetical protein [Brevundimonas sp.]MDP3803594.1 hypothetical protein [Brevundimonas sp.]